MASTPSVTTVFQPDPTCFAASNLWLERDRGGCNTYYTPFSASPTEVVTISECRYVRLGPFFGDYDNLCIQNNWVRTGSVIADNTAYSACPEGWTGVHTSTRSWSAITVEETACCPPAYEFTTANLDPTTYPTVIDGTTYPMTYPTMHSYCKAASVSQLSGSKVTLTVAASPSPTTTEVDWDYANDFIVAAAAKVEKYLYTGGPGTTSTCFGDKHCVMNSNPIKPHPTHARYGTYFPPPVTAVAQFTPAASCLASANLWLVSDQCSLATREPRTPPWLQCTHTVGGDPDPGRADCYPVGGKTVVAGTPTYYTGCPAGYTAANSTQYFPWTVARGGPAYSGVEATRLTCCPSAFNDVAFTHASPKWTYTTAHDGTTHMVSSAALPPWCAASGPAVAAPQQLGDKALTLGLYSNGFQGKPGKTYDGQSEGVWEEGNTLYAHPQTVAWTVFHGTHTCFEASECAEYFTYSYGNTMGPGVVVATPTPTRDSEGGGGGGGGGEAASSSSTGAAAALVPGRGDRRTGLGVVVVVVTVVVNVVLGAGLS